MPSFNWQHSDFVALDLQPVNCPLGTSFPKLQARLKIRQSEGEIKEEGEIFLHQKDPKHDIEWLVALRNILEVIQDPTGDHLQIFGRQGRLPLR
jgi:hypothetical protein